MIKVRKINTNEKAQFSNSDYVIVLTDGSHFFSRKALKELSLKIEQIFKSNEPKVVKNNEQAKGICTTCGFSEKQRLEYNTACHNCPKP